MKRVKSVIGIILAVAMIAVAFAFSASAAMSLAVAVDQTQVEPNDSVTATVSIDQPGTTLSSFTVQITYDPAVLELVTVTPAEYEGAVVSTYDEAGKININYISSDIQVALPQIATVATLEFKALATDTAAITAVFPANTMITLESANSGSPTYVQPGDGVYSETAANGSVEIVPEGTLGGEEPVEGDTGSANAESSGAAGTSSTDVLGTYATGARTDMFKVDVAWGALTYTYTESAETWDVDAHEWALNATDAVGTWAASEAGVSDKVTVTNHSSQAVTVELKWADDVADDGDLTGTWSAASIALAAPAEGAEEGVGDSATLTIAGKYTAEGSADAKIGTVTATIA